MVGRLDIWFLFFSPEAVGTFDLFLIHCKIASCQELY